MKFAHAHPHAHIICSSYAQDAYNTNTCKTGTTTIHKSSQETESRGLLLFGLSLGKQLPLQSGVLCREPPVLYMNPTGERVSVVFLRLGRGWAPRNLQFRFFGDASVQVVTHEHVGGTVGFVASVRWKHFLMPMCSGMESSQGVVVLLCCSICSFDRRVIFIAPI